MRMKNLLLGSLLAAISITACKKSSVVNGGSTPVEFKSTEYGYLGSYDSQGKPNYLVEKDPISNELLDYSNAKLPEYANVGQLHPEMLKNADLAITAKSDVYITFVNEGTGYLNSVGYYLFPSNNPPKKPEDIKKIIYIFPNSSRTGLGGTLNPGDKVKLGTIEAGMSIGFVLLEKGWDPNTQKVNDQAPHYLSNRELNPENREDLKPHTVLFDYPAENKVMIGFEDTNRTLPNCDHDFNDVLMYATVKPL